MDACGSCGGAMHRLCAADNAWLKFCGGASVEGLKCFECSLLEALLVGAAHPDQLAAYYRQQADWSRTGAGDVTAFTGEMRCECIRRPNFLWLAPSPALAKAIKRECQARAGDHTTAQKTRTPPGSP